MAALLLKYTYIWVIFMQAFKSTHLGFVATEHVLVATRKACKNYIISRSNGSPFTRLKGVLVRAGCADIIDRKTLQQHSRSPAPAFISFAAQAKLDRLRVPESPLFTPPSV